jgi:glycosyltransferase involved in cell wall biosynthesis
MNSNSKSLLLSVIVPVGDMAGRLHFLESWLQKASNHHIEVILIHDQTYVEVATELQELLRTVNSSKVILIQGLFGNPGGARNAGLDIAKGEWIGFWDSDDNPNIENICKAVQAADEQDEILIGDFTVFDLKSLAFRAPTRILDSLNSVAMNPGIWRMIFRSKTIGATRFPSLKMGEDQVFLSYLGFASRRLRFIESVFYQYNLGSPSQLTKSRKALTELPLASRLIFDHATRAPKKETIFDLQLFYRQQITIIKKGDCLLKLRALRLLGRLFLPFRFSFLIESFTALLRVLKSISKAGI